MRRSLGRDQGEETGRQVSPFATTFEPWTLPIDEGVTPGAAEPSRTSCPPIL
jgi:hypothetical protein